MKTKRALSLLLTLAMVFSLFGGALPAQAAEDLPAQAAEDLPAEAGIESPPLEEALPAQELALEQAQPMAEEPAMALSMDKDYLFAEGSNRLYLDTAGQAVKSVEYSYDGSKVTVDEKLGVIAVNAGHALTEKETVPVTATVTYYDPADVLFSDSFEGEKTFTDGGKENTYDHSEVKSHWGRKAATPVRNQVGPALHNIASRPEGTVTVWFYDPADASAEEVKVAFEVGKANYATGICLDGTGTFGDAERTHYVYRAGAAKGQYGWNASDVERTEGWHEFRWDVTSAGVTAYIDYDYSQGAVNTPIYTNDGLKSIDYLKLMTNWNDKSPDNIVNKLFVDDVTVVGPGADSRVKTVQVSLDVTLKPIIDYTQTGPTEAAFDKAKTPAEAVKTVIQPTTDLNELKVTLNGAPLTLNSQYTVRDGDVIWDEAYLKSLETGRYDFQLTIGNYVFPFTVTVIDTSGVTEYYFSNVSGSDEEGDGSEAKPYKSLDKLNALDLQPGDTVYLDAKSVWAGQIIITRSGAPGMPITITKYNAESREDRPVINAGPVVTAETAKTCKILELSQSSNPAAGALEIRSASYITVTGLELTNNGDEQIKDRIKGRNGILVLADVAGDTTAANYNERWEASYQTDIHIDDCYVHDVNSSASFKMAGGINIFGNIDNILVENCKVVDCDMEGIRNAGLYNRNNSWPAVHSVVFRNNYISGSAGDGMVISNVKGCTISGNVVTNCGDKAVSTANYAALWLIGAVDTVVEKNEVFNNPYVCNDGEAFDFDHGCEGSVYQYNYTHHNDGGAILFMSTVKGRNFYRYNISVEDGAKSATKPHLFFYTGSGDIAPYIYNNVLIVSPEIKEIFDGGGQVNFYNNILLSIKGNIPQLSTGNITEGTLKNNIIYPKTLLNGSISDEVDTTGNLFVNPMLAGPGEAPENVMTGATTAGAHLDLTKLQGYKLLENSPAINAGVVVELPSAAASIGQVTKDFFGNSIVGNPDIGVHEWSSDSPQQTVTEILPTGIQIAADKTDLEVEERLTLTATATPDNAWSNGCTWSSSDSAIVAVNADSGEITAVGPGKATITATSDAVPSLKDTVEITVKEPAVLAGFRVDTEHNYIRDEDGGKIQLSVVGVDNYGNDYFVAPEDIVKVEYTASVGTVDANGVLTIPQRTTGQVTVSAEVTLRNYDYLENFETGYSLSGGSTSLIRTKDKAFDGGWSAVTQDNSGSDDDAVKSFNQPRQGTVTVRFYDTANKTARKAISVSPDKTLYAIGVHKDGSTTNYSYRVDGTNNWKVSSIARTTGWHEFKWVFSEDGLSIYIDGELQTTNSKIKNYTSINILSRAGWTQSEHNGNFYIDAIKAWTDESTTSEKTADPVTLTANPEGTSEIYVSAAADQITTNYGTLQMSAEYLPQGEGQVVWSVISKGGQATIDQDGLLTALANGLVTVRATDSENSELYGEKNIVITGSLIHVATIQTAITDGENPPTKDKQQLQMVAKITPANASDKSVTWAVTDVDGNPTDLATIGTNGMLYCWKNGTVRVTATSKETPSLSSSLNVRIEGQLPRVTSITVNDPGTVKVGQTVTLTAIVSPENAGDPSISWYIADDGGTNAELNLTTGELKAGDTPGTITIAVGANENSNIAATYTLTIFADNADSAAIIAAKDKVEGAAYTATQAQAGDETQALEKAQALVNALALDGVTATVNKAEYVPAQTGTADHQEGVDGSLTFTVTLTKGAGTGTVTAKLTMTITATPYDSTDDDNAAIGAAKTLIEKTEFTAAQADADGEAAAVSQAQALVNALALDGVTAKVNRVTYTPAQAGTDGQIEGVDGSLTFTVTLNKGKGAAQTTAQLTMAITATRYDPVQDNKDIAAAKTAVEGASYTANQTEAGSETAAKVKVEAIIGALELYGVKAAVTTVEYTAPVAGTVEVTEGTNGTYQFTVTLSKGAGNTVTTTQLTMPITATAYDATQDGADIAAAKVLVEGASYTAAQSEISGESDALAKIQALIGGLELGGVTAQVNKLSYTEAVEGTSGNYSGTDGAYVFTVTLSKGAGVPVGTIELTLVITATEYDPPVYRPTKPTVKPEPPVVTVAPTEGGAVDSKTNRDGSVTYTFKPEAEKEVKYVRVNGLLVDADKVTVPAGETASIVVIFAQPDAKPLEAFEDVAQLPDYMAAGVEYAVSAQLFNGVGDGKFAPETGMNRAMFATVLSRLYGADTKAFTQPVFEDVDADSWFGPSVAWAAQFGLVTGVGDNSFAPDRDMTRQEMVVFIHRFAKAVGVDVSKAGDLSAFADTETLADWGKEAMVWAVGIGLVNGRGDNLAPADTITRGEAAVLLQRMSELLVK